MPRTHPAHFAAALAEEAAAARDRCEIRQRAIARLRALVGFETVYWGEPFASPRDDAPLCAAPTREAQGALTHFASDRRHFDVPHAIRRVRLAGGVAIGREILSEAESDPLPVYAEVLRPADIRSYIFCEISFRGRVQSTLTLSRHGRGKPFGPHDTGVVRSVKASLGLVEAAYATPAVAASATPTPPSLRERFGLTPRESEVATHVACGLGNKEIAHLLGTSPETVRKQTIRVYAKVGVRGRVELAAVLAGSSAPGVGMARLGYRA